MEIIMQTLDMVDSQNPKSILSEIIKFTIISIALMMIKMTGSFFFIASVLPHN